MSKGFDCATPLTASLADLFSSQGFKFVCRYLAPAGSWKRLTAGEAKTISYAGLYIVSVFERGAANALMGAAQGLEDGALALQYAREVGQPEGSVIYAAVDTDVNASQYDAIEAYMRAFDSQIEGYELGAYGEYEACKMLRDRGAVSKVWQTYAWSKGAKMSEPNLYQFENDVRVNDIGIDRDESNGDAGGWKVDMAIRKEALSIDPGAVNFIIDALKYYYDEMEGQPGIQTYTHDCANALRRAVGRPEE
ncbi:DUF1906 domain-containing protein [Paenibacillus sp. MAH-36]|uniref:DUF1906 domain-containing protein n=1 Tax=Paenibacillus violae TaxID=3077234 RepID=A0ABU3R7Y9_9BACL|nr:DUF1906 domain-containing protein [Paenibacillus sp. PFR10]MDU0200176.1 DUF1906 domain-containing protein [Paenibacillus sp. PFR10]